MKLIRYIKRFRNEVTSPHNKSSDSNCSIKKVFISHSSKDKAIVGSIIELLEVIGISHKNIFCSSFEGYGIELGSNFIERLKKELSAEVLVLFILSENFYRSPICLCEMDAAWIKANEIIP